MNTPPLRTTILLSISATATLLLSFFSPAIARAQTAQAESNFASMKTLGGSGRSGGGSSGTMYEPYTFRTSAGMPGMAGAADGSGSAASFNGPDQLAMDGAGNIYIADGRNNIIRQVSSSGVVRTIAGIPGAIGNQDGSGATATFTNPFGVAYDAHSSALNGNLVLYVANTGSATIREITCDASATSCTVTTVAGMAGVLGSSNGTGTAARFKNPDGVAVAPDGVVYVADTSNGLLRKITSSVYPIPANSGVVTTVASGFRAPRGPACDNGGNVYLADRDNDTIDQVTPSGVVTVIAGSPRKSGSNDGIGMAARFNAPHGVALDDAGNLYVADAYNDLIRKIVLSSGVVTTLGGVPQSAGSTDGSGSAARFSQPRGVVAASSLLIYVADYGNNTIRTGTNP